MPNFQPDIDLLDLAERLHEAADKIAGGFVCIERRHRPWRIMLLTGVDSATLTTKGGFTYDRDTGMPLFDAHDTVLHPLTQERLEYLIIAESLKAAERITIHSLTAEERTMVLPAARIILDLNNRLREAEQRRHCERLRSKKPLS